MFMCRAVRHVKASSVNYYHLSGSVQLVTSRPPDAIWTLRKSSVNSGDGGAGCKHVDLPWGACKSDSRLGVFLPFSWRNGDRKTNDRLHSLRSFSCPGAQTCCFHSSPNDLLSSALSNASDGKQGNWTKREPAVPLVKEVLHSKSPHGGAEKPEPEEKQNKTKQLRKVFKEYGAVGVTFHIGISLISLGIFYVALSSGINMTDVLCKLGFSESVVQSKMAAGTSTFVLAYAIHKLFAPFRISITLVSVPLIVRYLRRTGLFKSLPPHM